MKAVRFASLLLLILMLMAGCAKKDNQVSEKTVGSIEDFFQVVENIKYIYEGAGNEFAGYTVYTDYTAADRIQQRIENGGTVAARVYEIKDGKLTMVFSKGEVYYRENMLEKTDGTEEVMLMEPLAKGTVWPLKDGSERTITGTDTEVTTPVGTFACLEVATERKDSTTIHYYAKDIGLIKTIFRSEGMEVTSTLKSIEKDAVRTQAIRIYVPDLASGGIQYVEREVSYRTNDDTGKVLEAACKKVVNEVSETVLSEDTAINSLALDEENRVKIDFNSSFTADMDAAAGFEPVILQCIANTLGYYYNTESVILTVDGKPYRSERIRMEEGQAMPVKLDENN